MKKNLISLAVAASVLGGAAVQAGQHVNPDKTGQVLLFPFYNADNGNATNMHIVNTMDEPKAVKVRFVEYKNSDEVLDFNLYLSANDHFAFGVIKNPLGTGAAIITQDNSCTVPALGSANPPLDGTATTNADGSITRIQPFTNYLYATSEDFDSSIERTLTGHVEVIEMGVLNNVGTVTVPATVTSKTQFAAFATHGATGVPANCAGLVAGWDSSLYSESAVTEPTGGLYGVAYHINVGSAAAFGFEPTAIDDFLDTSSGSGHSNPGDLTPSFMTAGVPTATVKSNDANVVYKDLTMTNGTFAASAILMTESVSNDVMVNPAIGGMTDWVVTFPTKRAHVDDATAIAPFTGTWTALAGTSAATYKEVPACETVGFEQFDREEQSVVTSGLKFSPKVDALDAKICNEVAVIAMGPAGTASALNVETGLTNLSFPYAEGWQRMSFTQTFSDGGFTFTGLPITGFAAYKVSNGAMSYGNAAEHKMATKNVTSS